MINTTVLKIMFLVCPSKYIDLMFVLDGSGSVNAKDDQNFIRVKNWVKSVTSKFDLNGSARVGIVQYSHWYRSRFGLSQGIFPCNY